jgi:phosphoribosylformylglycinamidine cyclo-ligase
MKKSSTRKFRTYAGAGVDIHEGDALVRHLQSINPAIGGFSGLFPVPNGMKNPQLVAATDGVGTKLLVAQAMKKHDTIGVDLVAMCVNDLIVCGARPLFFLDYFATGKLKGGEAQAVLDGIISGCEQAGCPLIGGETAEMPGMYNPGHYDLAGFAVGIIDRDHVIDGRHASPGDLVIGLASNGLHSNGFSLARNVLLPDERSPADLRRALAKKLHRMGPSIAEAMLLPTRIYVRTVLDLLKKHEIHASAHITGGGIEGNLVRVLPPGVRAFINLDCWQPPRIFSEIANRGPVDEAEMFRVFNMGIGFIMVVNPEHAQRIIKRASKLGENASVIGWLDRANSKKTPPSVIRVRSRAE